MIALSRSATRLALAGAATLGMLLVGCGGDGVPSLPSLLTVPPSSPTSSLPAPSATTATSTPAPDAGPRLTELRGEAAASDCFDGSVPVVLTYQFADQASVQVLTVVVDGSPAVASGEPGCAEPTIQQRQLMATGHPRRSSWRREADVQCGYPEPTLR